MIDVKLSTCAPKWPWARQTPGGRLEWGGFRFHVDVPLTHCDAWVVFESLQNREETVCPAERTLFVSGEPDSIGRYHPGFLDQFAWVVSGRKDIAHPRLISRQQGHPWFVEKTYDELTGMVPAKKTRDICLISSDKAFTEGHRQRLDFTSRLKDVLGDRLDVWGRGIRDFDRKWEVLAPYRYAVVLENFAGNDFLTEKLPDALLAYCVPLYFGCRNPERYLPPGSWVDIDINDPAGAAALLKKFLDDPADYARRLPAITTARQQYLERLQFFASLAEILNAILGITDPQPLRCTLRPNLSFAGGASNPSAAAALPILPAAIPEPEAPMAHADGEAQDAEPAAAVAVPQGMQVRRLLAGALRVAGWRMLLSADKIHPLPLAEPSPPSEPAPLPEPPPAPPPEPEPVVEAVVEPSPPSLKEVSYQKWQQVSGDKTLRLDYPLASSDVVLDVGGFEGQWASDIFGRYLCTIHVFEPVPEFADDIARRFANNARILLHRTALGARDGSLQMAISGDASSGLIEGVEPVSVPMRRFADWLDQAGMAEVALMKINIEGGEYELLQHMIETQVVRRVRDLQIQFHDFVPDAEARMNAILEGLARTHRPTYQFPFIWENWSRLEASSWS